MINKILLKLVVLTFVLSPCILTERSSAEETKESQLATTEVSFSEKASQRIDVVDVDFDYYSTGLPPMRENAQFNNITPEWNYGLFGQTYVGSQVPTDGICFSMWLACTRVGTDASDDPTPWTKDGMRAYVATHEASIIQQKLGSFFCNYGTLKKGDIFPLADRLYYVDDYLSATVVSPSLGAKIATRYLDQNSRAIVVAPYLEIKIPWSKTTSKASLGYYIPIKGLCVPLTSGTNEVASQAEFSYLPGLNLFVSRIYLVPTKDSYQYAARICTKKDIVDVIQFDPFSRGKRPGRIKIQEPSDDVIDLENEQVEVQEVVVGDIIKGDKLGYRVLTIVPPDREPWRVVFDRNVRESRRVEKGRLIGWVELDPKPIPLDENGIPLDEN